MSEPKLTRKQQAEQYLRDPQMRNYLDLLSYTEGTEENGYHTTFGNKRIEDLSWHPNKVWGRTGDGVTTATGRYQFLGSTWNEQAKKLGLKDFGPESQDLAAVSLIMQNGAAKDILNGDIDTANRKLSKIWASLPYNNSPHQAQKSVQDVNRKWQELQGRPASNTHSIQMPENVKQTSPVSNKVFSAFTPVNSFTLPTQPEPQSTANPFSSVMESFNSLNNTMGGMTSIVPEPVIPKRNYDAQLAEAFGIEPPTGNKLDPHIAGLLESIWDNQA